jgi:electron transfer flavoprotein alpha subunit
MTNARAVVALIPVGYGSVNPLDPARLAAAIGSCAGMPSVAVFVGADAKAIAENGRQLGVEASWAVQQDVAVDGLYAPALAEVFLAVLNAYGLIGGAAARLILLPYGAIEEEVAAILAVRLGGTPLGKCSSVNIEDEGCRVTKPAYGGRIISEIFATKQPFICLVRPDTISEQEAAATEPPVMEFPTPALPADLVKIERTKLQDSSQAPLEGAKIIISGGRGIGGGENFVLLEEIASAVGGVVGCSLPVADLGWRPISHQIGQSGKFVTPDIYLAVAISGMSQHLAGIGETTRILAINQDPDAAIWSVAEVGILSDWQKILPPLLKQLQKHTAVDLP